jgi:hypothetical protein
VLEVVERAGGYGDERVERSGGGCDLGIEADESLDPVGLFKKAMLSTVVAFCKRPWYLSNISKREFVKEIKES